MTGQFRATRRTLRRLALLCGGLVALAAAAAASALTIGNGTTITINDAPSCGTFTLGAGALTIDDSISPPTASSPYPSEISVAGAVGTVADVDVVLNGFAHTFPDDVDVLLVGPTGASAVLMSDAGGATPASGLTLTLDDEAASSLPDEDPLSSGSFKPTDFEAGDSFPAPAPTGPYGSALSDLDGTDPNGTWQLYVVDDQGDNAGSIDSWELRITVSVASPCPQAATPYPSTIDVSGLTGTVKDVNLTLNGFTHSYPDDVDVLLVGPTGAMSIPLSDVGGNPNADNLTITLDDEAASALPDDGPLVSGSFIPTNIDLHGDDPFPAPAPAGPYPTPLSAFDGTDPNGTWSLYVVDDAAADVGAIAQGWTLELDLNAPPTAVTVRGFSARPSSHGVALRWRTASETEIAGFNLYRSGPDTRTQRLNRRLIAAGHSGSAAAGAYRFSDPQARAGRSYTYRLEVVKLDGRRQLAGSVSLRTLG